MICWIRDTSEANVAMTIRPSASAKTDSNVSPTTVSDGVRPGYSTWTQSEMSSLTPRPPNSASALVVRQLAIGRGRIELEVACDDHETAGRGNRESDRVGDAVADPERFEGEAPGLQAGMGIRIEPIEFDLLGQAVLGQFDVDQADGQWGRIDRRAQLWPQVGQPADVVLVAMGDEDAADVRPARSRR